MMKVAVQSRCRRCIAGKLPKVLDKRVRPYRVAHKRNDALLVCNNYDEECRHIGEPFGFYTFAWKPKRCRNGRLRWLTWVERHDYGTLPSGTGALT